MAARNVPVQMIAHCDVDGKERMFELRYTVRAHKWALFREVY